MGQMKRILAGLLAAGLSAPAAAQPMPSFEAIDTNGDGVITRAEWMAYVEDQRAQLRSRHGPDAEARALREAEGVIDGLDTDGMIGARELGMVRSALRWMGPDQAAALGAQLLFERVDTNGDGVVDRAEFAAGERELRTAVPSR